MIRGPYQVPTLTPEKGQKSETEKRKNESKMKRNVLKSKKKKWKTNFFKINLI